MLALDLRKQANRLGLYPFVLLKEDIPTNWDLLEPFIERSVEHSHGMLTLECIHQRLLDGLAVCIGTISDQQVQAVIVCQPVYYSSYTAGRIIAAAGRNLGPSMAFFHVVEEWAFGLGAVEIEAWCRPAVVRLLRTYGWRRKGLEMLSIDMRRKLQ